MLCSMAHNSWWQAPVRDLGVQCIDALHDAAFPDK